MGEKVKEKKRNAENTCFFLFSSTVYISLYYSAFYVLMTSIFLLSIWALMRSLDPYTPDYQDRLQSPGMTRLQRHLTLDLRSTEPPARFSSLSLTVQGWWCGLTPTERRTSKSPTTCPTGPAGWGWPTSFTGSCSVRILLAASCCDLPRSKVNASKVLASLCFPFSLQWQQAAWMQLL